jgi:glycerate dehydrogenase
MYEVVFLDSATIANGIVRPRPNFMHNWTDYDRTNEGQTIERAKQAQLIVTNKVLLNSTVLASLPKLKHIAIAATGTNSVDLKVAAAMGISVSNVPGYATRSVSEHVMAMILGLRRNLLAFQTDISAGKWQASEQFCFHSGPIYDLSKSTLGLIGTGTIAQQVAYIAKAMGMKVIYHSVSGRKELPGERLVSLDTLLDQSDVVSLHCPLTATTENLIDTPQLQRMRKNALIINTARGSIVNLQALYNALVNNEIAGAGIDVAPVEPPPKDSPIMQLNTLQNCIVSPHAAWASQEASQILINQVVDNLDAFVAGNPINLVN